MEKRDYTVEELVEDPSFRRMARGIAGAEEVEWWNEWIEESDDHRKKAKAALADIAGFEFDLPNMPDVEQKWAELYEETVGRQKKQSTPRLMSTNTLNWIYRAAALLLIITTVGIGINYYGGDATNDTRLQEVVQRQTFNTDEGEQKTLKFSNGARVVLNSNSSLIYHKNSSEEATIRLTLNGEAFFDVEPNADREEPAFQVSTPDGMIEDIGTEFLVTVENDRSRVVLQEGYVKIRPRSGDTTNEMFYVNKGELVEFSKKRILRNGKVNSTFYTSWATGMMKFEQTPITRFADYVEDRFDVNVQLEGQNLKNIRLDGAIYFKSLEELVRSVSDVIKVPVYQSQDRNTVFIGDPNESNSANQNS